MLKEINDRCFVYMHEKANFFLKKGDIGIYSAGTCWRLLMHSQNQETVISCFVTSGDGHDCQKKYSCEGRFWTKDEIIPAAEKMIEAILG